MSTERISQAVLDAYYTAQSLRKNKGYDEIPTLREVWLWVPAFAPERIKQILNSHDKKIKEVRDEEFL